MCESTAATDVTPTCSDSLRRRCDEPRRTADGQQLIVGMRRFRCDSIYVSYRGGAALHLDLTALMPSAQLSLSRRQSSTTFYDAAVQPVLKHTTSSPRSYRYIRVSRIRTFPPGRFRHGISCPGCH